MTVLLTDTMGGTCEQTVAFSNPHTFHSIVGCGTEGFLGSARVTQNNTGSALAAAALIFGPDGMVTYAAQDAGASTNRVDFPATAADTLLFIDNLSTETANITCNNGLGILPGNNTFVSIPGGRVDVLVGPTRLPSDTWGPTTCMADTEAAMLAGVAIHVGSDATADLLAGSSVAPPDEALYFPDLRTAP